jgi:ribonuclease R
LARRSRTAEEFELPTREAILAFIASTPGKVGKRELARHFGIGGGARVALKRLLKDLEAEGVLERGRRTLHQPGELAAVVVARVAGRDRDGDLIASPDEWDETLRGPAPRIVLHIPRREKHGGPPPGVGDLALVRTERERGEKNLYTGRVIKLLSKTKDRTIGVFREDKSRGGGRLLPVDKKARGVEMIIRPGDEGEAEDGDLIAVDVSRDSRLGLRSAKVREVLGSPKSEKAASLIAIHQHGIPHVFPDAALKEAAAAREPDLAAREDWRDIPLLTIDPADAKDHDDAIYAEPDSGEGNPGGFVLLVAIADVAAYVRPHTALDREALIRGNSVYFPDRVVPMLPERISNDLCSLKPGVHRAALAMRIVIDAQGRKKSHSVHRILMRSAAKLAYPQAQAAIDGHADDTTGPLLDSVLRPLWDAYAALKHARAKRAPLDLDLPERKLVLNPDGTLKDVIIPERLDAHRLIEEFMILANVCAAETLEKARTLLLYRIHDEPSLEKMESLRDFLSTIGIDLPKAGALKPELFNRILARVRGTPNENLANEVVLRSQAQAEYSPENIGHFGLNLRRYAHFTSPIRRYADLIVHRGLIHALNLGRDGLPDMTLDQMREIGASISAAERRAMAAERDTVDRLIAHHLADRIGASFSGRIAGVTRAGLFVKLDGIGADGFVPAATLGADYFSHDERSHALVGGRTGESYRLGDPVKVRLVEAQPTAGALRFEMLSQGHYIKGARRGQPPKGKGRLRPEPGAGRRRSRRDGD